MRRPAWAPAPRAADGSRAAPSPQSARLRGLPPPCAGCGAPRVCPRPTATAFLQFLPLGARTPVLRRDAGHHGLRSRPAALVLHQGSPGRDARRHSRNHTLATAADLRIAAARAPAARDSVGRIRPALLARHRFPGAHHLAGRCFPRRRRRARHIRLRGGADCACVAQSAAGPSPREACAWLCLQRPVPPRGRRAAAAAFIRLSGLPRALRGAVTAYTSHPAASAAAAAAPHFVPAACRNARPAPDGGHCLPAELAGLAAWGPAAWAAPPPPAAGPARGGRAARRRMPPAQTRV